jgi:hypothetical protein
MSDGHIRIGDLVKVAVMSRVEPDLIGLVIKIHRRPTDVKLHNVLEVMCDGSIHVVPEFLCKLAYD